MSPWACTLFAQQHDELAQIHTQVTEFPHQVLSQDSRHFHNLTTQKNTQAAPAFPKASTGMPFS